MKRPSGFVLPVVLGLILITGLLAVQATTDLGSHTMLATHRLLQQRAFEAAERGLALTLNQLRSGVTPEAGTLLPSSGLPTDSTQIGFTTPGSVSLPVGFSSGRVVESYHEIHSTGHSARGARVTLVQGVRQLQALRP
ncbi:MAG: hypothetical protein QM696_01135 [Steroidobacteraceae bacterium]